MTKKDIRNKDRKISSKESIKKEGGSPLVITRVFDAPREIVWKAWTEPEEFMHWWGPKNFITPVAKIDFRAGGKYLNCMRSVDGRDYWSTGVYREIVPTEKLVMTDSFSDKNGSILPASHHGLSGDWPLEMLITVTFEEAGGKTKMTLLHSGIPEGIIQDNTRTSWSESFDKLAEHLAKSGKKKVA